MHILRDKAKRKRTGHGREGADVVGPTEAVPVVARDCSVAAVVSRHFRIAVEAVAGTAEAAVALAVGLARSCSHRRPHRTRSSWRSWRQR